MKPLQVPTTDTMPPAALKSPNCTDGGKAGCAWRGVVVGRFLHASSFYFFDHLSHTTAHNFVERVQ